jgi:hypothetical protein
MKRLALIIICFLILHPSSWLFSQESVRKPFILSTCYAGNKVKSIYVPPPNEFFSRLNRKGGAVITVKYTGFSAAAKAAVEYAARILESVLPPDAHFTVLATWEKITTSGVLAQSSTTDLIPGWGINAQVPYALYPIALAEKIAGKSLNKESEGDIVLYVNSSVNWYLGTDGKPLSLKYDLVTVVLHEMIHGLGFLDSMTAGTTTASYGVSGVPMVYDTFTENLAGKRLTDTLSFMNPSSDLKGALTSGQLYFNGPLIKNYTIINKYPVARARLYAPATFDAGSSVSHLDESSLSTRDSDALMTPIIDYGEAIHNPGRFTMSMLGDLGWVNTRIIHTKPKDTEEHISSLPIAASIESDTSYNHSKVSLVWSFDNFLTSSSTLMNSPSSDNNYSASVSIAFYETTLEYYISAEDCFGRVYKSPSYTDKYHYSVHIGTDTVKPVITHSRLTSFFEKVNSISFEAGVTDNLGVDTVYLEYIVNYGTPSYIGLKAAGNDVYKSNLYPKALSLAGGDSIRYRIIAYDKAGIPNEKILPSSGWYTIKVESLKPVAKSYSTDFSNASGDFLNNGFTISKPTGFSEYGLHTPHPYASPEDTIGDSIGYIATLRAPLKFDSNGMMISFREVVMVEPGESGSVFGSSDFYDYVIAEGSKDFGKSWFHLGDGYDSQYYDAWLTAYNSSTDGQNSTYVPDQSLLIRHYFFVKTSSSVASGDTILVRFRLFSDPYAHGWGWVIQDLNLEPLIDRVEVLNYPEPVLFPNPGNGIFTVKNEEDVAGSPYRYTIFNSTGASLLTGTSNSGSELNINISDYPPGQYIIVLYRKDGMRTLRYNLVK